MEHFEPVGVDDAHISRRFVRHFHAGNRFQTFNDRVTLEEEAGAVIL